MANNLIVTKKLKKAKNTTIFCADMDGTLFTAGWRILQAPLYNIQTSQILRLYKIPFIVVTGRPQWNTFFDYEMLSHGLPFPDVVITATGTEIFERNTYGFLKKDTSWEKGLHNTQITMQTPNGEIYSVWNKNPILSSVTSYFEKKELLVKISSDNDLAIRINALNLPIKELNAFISHIDNLWRKGVSVIATEKLLKENSLETFSGSILITPKSAGKDKAIEYILNKYQKNIDNKITAFIFGDASIDIPMLTMNPANASLIFHQYAVHPTPLTKKILSKRYPAKIIENYGPQSILYIMKKFLTEKKTLSLSQNNKVRFFIQPFEPILNLLIDKNMTPNEISFLGLTKTQQGINNIESNQNIFIKIKGLQEYIQGISIDFFDGIRARQTNTFEENGQLVDAFCDRTKEFYQLLIRAKKRTPNIQQEYQTLLSAISCVLPSIARAQAEIQNNILQERDPKGGSMIDRTKLLFVSILYQTISNDKKSYEIDKEIFEKNIATYKNRMKSIQIFHSNNLKEVSELQKKSLERFLLLIEILQEENKIVKNILGSNKEYREKYTKEYIPTIQDYLNISVDTLRKKYDFKTYDFSISQFII